MSEFRTRLENLKLKNLKVKHEKHKQWPLEKKVECVATWLACGNLRLAAATIGASYELVRQWKIQPWWDEIVQEIRMTEHMELDSKLSKIANRSLDVAIDRLENGDFIYDQKTGEMKRKPVSMKDAAKVSVDVLTKRELLRGNATSRAETAQVPIQEQLAMLAAEFAKWQNPKLKREAEDIEFVEIVKEDSDAVHEKRETGLQEGSEGIHEPTGSGEEADTAECSTPGNGEGGESLQGGR